MISQLIHQFVADVVSDLAADILAPALRHSDTGRLRVCALQHGIDVAGIEVIPCTNGADGFNRLHRIGLTPVRRINADRTCAVC